nr:hypothetical protein [Thermoleophilaceae bacterium]
LVERTSEEPVTQFEALTAAAFHELARAGVEVAVIEAGLGGRHDATNVIPSSVHVLTGVGLEHTRWLGSTLAGIAEEKLAVVRDHGCLVTPPGLDPEVEAVATRVAAEHSAERYRAGEDLGLELRARGQFQRRNFALAVTAAQAFLARAGLEPLQPAEIAAAARRTEIPGRLQVVDTDPLTLLDGAHNPAGTAALAESLPEVAGGRPLTAVLSVLDDKDAEAILGTLAPLCERAVFTRCANPRALPPEELAAMWAGPAETVPEPRAALARARESAGQDGAVLATGSIYLIADLVRDPGVAKASTL